MQIPVPAANSGRNVKIAFSGYGQDNPWSAWMFAAIKDEAAHYGATATFVGPSTADAQGQSSALSDIATAKNYNAVIVLSIDGAEVVPSVKQLIAAGIKVAGVDHVIGPNQTATQTQVPGVTTEVIDSSVTNAITMADGVVKACQGTNPCKVDVLWGARSAAFDAVKVKPFDAIVAKHTNIQLVCQTDANYTQDLGRTQTADCLRAHPDLNVVASQADESARGAQGAITAAGKKFGLGKSDIKIIGSYASMYGIQQVRAGKWVQTWYGRCQSLGRTAVDLLLEKMAGKQVPSWIPEEDLDNLPDGLDKTTLVKNPLIQGQWQG